MRGAFSKKANRHSFPAGYRPCRS